MNNKRLEAYTDKITETIPEGKRHVELNRIVFNIASAFPELSERDLLEAANRLNERLCSPPLSSCDVASIVVSVMKADKPVKQSAVRRRQTAMKPAKVCAETRTIPYNYRDYDEHKAYRKFRVEVTGKNKTFYFKPKGIKQHYPYGLSTAIKPEVKNNISGLEYLFIVEGEQSAIRLYGDYVQAAVWTDDNDFPICRATTLDTGSNAAKQWADHIAALGIPKETVIVILPDNDDAGRKYAHGTAGYFHDAGYSTRIVELPNLPSGGDYVDFRNARISPANGVDCVEVFRQLLTLVASAPQYESPKTEIDGDIDDDADDAETAMLQPAALNIIIMNILPVDWTKYFRITGKDGDTVKPPSERDYILRTIERILLTAKTQNVPFVCKGGQVFVFSETYYVPIDETAMKTALIELSLACGIPNDTAVYQFFVEKIYRQFLICVSLERMNISEPAETYINLQNGTLFFGKDGAELKQHSPENFIRYCLSFDYNSEAKCPMWNEHLRRSLPDTETADYLAECFALPFYGGKIEKCVLLYGQPATGKSVSLDVLSAVLGKENISHETLAKLTSSEYTGDYSRFELDGKLANIAADISSKPRTISAYRQSVGKLLEYFGKDRHITDITPDDAVRFATQLRNTVKTQSYAGITLQRCKTVFTTAFNRGLIEKNPFACIKSGMKRGDKKKQYFVSVEEFNQLLTGCNTPSQRLILILARYGGLRCPSELTGLRWSEIDFDKKRFVVHSPKTEHHIGHDYRIVPLFPEVERALTELYETLPVGSPDRIFPDVTEETSLGSFIEKTAKRSGIVLWEKPFVNLRSTRATELIAIFPAHVVNAIMGHTETVALVHYRQVLESDYVKLSELQTDRTQGGVKSDKEPAGKGLNYCETAMDNINTNHCVSTTCNDTQDAVILVKHF
ncbi:MAG: tyrosine-type recombinase/integrase [Planctomycetaceae bacterium]|nr:tyrosine-type recombinase/integrase [Planctomycetaceae bacterium]